MSWSIIKIQGSKVKERKKLLQLTCHNLTLAKIFLNHSSLQPPILDHLLNNTPVDLPIHSTHIVMCVDGYLKIENYKDIPIDWLEADEFINMEVQVVQSYPVYSMIRYTDKEDELEVYSPLNHV